MFKVHRIDNDVINTAYSAAVAKAAEYRRNAALIAQIAAALDDVYCTRAIINRITPILPDSYRAIYFCDYNKNKCIRIYSQISHCDIDLRICQAGARRTSAAAIVAQADYYQRRAAAIDAALVDYYSMAQQYAVLGDALRRVRDTIAPVIQCIDINF